MKTLSTSLLKGNVGIPRASMPQFGFIPEPGSLAYSLPRDKTFGGVDLGALFWEHMVRKGVKMEFEPRKVIKLRATQKELNMDKVCSISKSIEAGLMPPQCLFIHEEGYIVDGHHRWGGEVLAGLRLGDLRRRKTMTSAICGMSIEEVIAEANRFCDHWMRVQ